MSDNQPLTPPNLDLDSFNPWQYKPWWCQPWSILLTGAIAIFLPAQLTRNLWIAGGIAIPVMVWWAYFLLLWPRLLKAYYRASGESLKALDEPSPPPIDDGFP